ncbi:AGC/PKA protein kinase [Saprolegnia parasitica CBS 223.65]|uniref:AGC/PKA protein kinase n=1 Tax=Saprolegnia parasitica (strain CBS 223.65) TaxID=695850 RepID=A0A067BXR6_SAPPC|nr:AGC/PKA protein kinase [Saprolegnia parasitica CBS 223.65]KDO23068.1 AGC/PKA protein kinase [Saprolegnia parasitica CBS 223.65]|eukprot:XP_012206184.1 AGC/PKA protein kinase [Saprolegnia parasitica CBS 223.65]
MDDDNLAPSLADLEKLYLLGKGGCGRVYKCRDRRTAQEFAVKEIEIAGREDRCKLEADAMGPLLVRSVRSASTMTLVMRYLPGEALYKCLWRCTRFSEGFAKACAAQIAAAIVDLHGRGYMHRDIKSGNVLLTRDGHCHLVDFGLAASSATRATAMCGTHYTMAPEILDGHGYDAAVDWWAFGVLLFEMVHGSPPWPYKSDESSLPAYFARMRETAAHLPWTSDVPLSAELQSLISGLLQVDPAMRLGPSIQSHPWFRDLSSDLAASGPELETGFQHVDGAQQGVDSAESITSAENLQFAGF